MDFAIIAAGDGSRLTHEGITRPKPLVELCGRPMIGRLIDIMSGCGADRISVITNSRMPDVADYLRSTHWPVKVDVTVMSTPSSMHSFREVTRGFEGKFIATTVDTIFRPEEFARYVDDFRAADDIDGLMGVTSFIDDEKPLYVETDSSLRITAFSDTATPGARNISGGIYGLTPRALDILDSCLQAGMSRMRNFQRQLIAGGLNIQAWPFSKVIDVDHAADIDTAANFLQQQHLKTT